MSATLQAIAEELPKHVDMNLFEDVDDAGGKRRRDTGGLCCSCGEWQAPQGPYPQLARPRQGWQEHVALAIQRAIATDAVVEALNAANGRVAAQRLGKSITREMDKDILVLRQSAAALIDLIGDDRG